MTDSEITLLTCGLCRQKHEAPRCPVVDQIREMFESGASESIDWRLGILRKAGWMIAAHNDYRQGGELMTFYLFVRDNRYALKGEAYADNDALDQVLKQAFLHGDMFPSRDVDLPPEYFKAMADREDAADDPPPPRPSYEQQLLATQAATSTSGGGITPPSRVRVNEPQLASTTATPDDDALSAELAVLWSHLATTSCLATGDQRHDETCRSTSRLLVVRIASLIRQAKIARDKAFKDAAEMLLTLLRKGPPFTPEAVADLATQMARRGEHVPVNDPPKAEPSDKPLSKAQRAELRRLLHKPQNTYGSSRSRIQNTLVSRRLAVFTSDGDWCLITDAGCKALGAEAPPKGRS